MVIRAIFTPNDSPRLALAAEIYHQEAWLTICSKEPFLSACQLPCNLSKISAELFHLMLPFVSRGSCLCTKPSLKSRGAQNLLIRHLCSKGAEHRVLRPGLEELLVQMRTLLLVDDFTWQMTREGLSHVNRNLAVLRLPTGDLAESRRRFLGCNMMQQSDSTTACNQSREVRASLSWCLGGNPLMPTLACALLWCLRQLLKDSLSEPSSPDEAAAVLSKGSKLHFEALSRVVLGRAWPGASAR